jgi:hypothetical protein
MPGHSVPFHPSQSRLTILLFQQPDGLTLIKKHMGLFLVSYNHRPSLGRGTAADEVHAYLINPYLIVQRQDK